MTIDIVYQFIFAAGILTLLSVLASQLSRRTGAPVLLLFLVLGMLAGEDGIGIPFDNIDLAFLLGNVALAVIILDGGLGTQASSFRVSLPPAVSLATFGVLITAGITGYAAHKLLGLPWQEGLLIGAIVGSTDAAAVFGLIRNAGLKLNERTGATLEIESGSNDPMAIFLTITLVQWIQLSNDGDQQVVVLAIELLRQLGLGLLLGLLGGVGINWLFKHTHLTASLYPLMVLAGGISLFGITNIAGGSGYLAIFIVGVIVGNTPIPYGQDVHRFHDGMAWLSQIGMFLMLGLLITPSNLLPMFIPALIIALVLIFIARPVAVVVSLLPFRFPWREQVFISWCGLRGAVPIILALFPFLAGLEHTKLFFDLVFFVVLISLVLQGWTIPTAARWLNIEIPGDTTQEPRVLSMSHSMDLVVYPVLPGSQAENKRLAELPVEDSQAVGVIRDGHFISSAPELSIARGDQVMALSPGGIDPTLAQSFKLAPHTLVMQSEGFFGEFSVNPQAKLVDIVQAYGLSLDVPQSEATVADYLQRKYRGKLVQGDYVKLGSVRLIVRDVEKGAVKAVGLKLG